MLPRKSYGHAPNKGSLVEFKNEMLKGLYDTKLKKTCLFCMPKELKQKREKRPTETGTGNHGCGT